MPPYHVDIAVEHMRGTALAPGVRLLPRGYGVLTTSRKRFRRRLSSLAVRAGPHRAVMESRQPVLRRQFDAHGAEQLDDTNRSLTGEVGGPGDQQVVVANVPVDGLERLEGPEPETARGLGEPEACPPGDVPRLDSRFEQ